MPFPHAYTQLVQALDQLPTVGPVAAERFAQFLLNSGHGHQLQQALTHALAQLKRCEQCQTYSLQPCCERCQDSSRSQYGLLVVATLAHQQQAEQRGFAGHFFVLHGLLSPVAGCGPKQLGLEKLQEQLAATRASKIIIALEHSAEGRVTQQYIQSWPQLSGKVVQAMAWDDWLKSDIA